MKAYKTLLRIEGKLSLRGIDMMIFAIIMPVVITILLGIIYGTAPASSGAAYTFLEQSFAALASIAICAGGVMGLPLLISDYRQKKILRRFYVTPISPVLILAVHLTIYALYSVASLIIIFITAKLLFQFQFHGSILIFLGSYLLVMISTFSIGVLVGGLSPDAKTAGIIASLLYFPMLILSGATLPYEVMPPALQKAADLLPLTQGIKLLKAASLGLPLSNVTVPIIIMLAFAVVCTTISTICFRWE